MENLEGVICLLSNIPVRSNPDDRSEMVTQMLFGDMALVLGKKGKWLQVQQVTDHYQGWVSTGQLHPIDMAEIDRLTTSKVTYAGDLVQLLHNLTDDYTMLIPAASTFYNASDGQFSLAEKEWSYLGSCIDPNLSSAQASISSAMLFLHTPYLWGGKSAFGIDCSGLTQIALRMAGKQIHRDASQQAGQGETVDLINEALPGDLCFFDNDEGDIIHTGIYIQDSLIIHAHQRVRVDKIDHYGIFNTELGKYTHKLRLIKRFW